MWIVRLALNRPYTFVVAALLVLLLGVLSILRTPTDIFPNINIPIVSVIWSYSGLPPEEIENRIVTNFERAATTMVNADTLSRAETKGQSHRQIDVRDPGRGGRSYTADRYFLLPEGPPLPGEVPAAA